MCRKSIGSGQMENLDIPVKFMTSYATFNVHGKNQTIVKVYDFTGNLPFIKILLPSQDK